MRLGVLVSGKGSILEALLGADLPVGLVVADRPCRGLEIAREAGVRAVLVDRKEFGGFSPRFDRDAFTRAVVEVLVEHGIEVVAMAGFGTVLSPSAHEAFPDRMLNTHPSLLPSFPGWHPVEDALAAGVAVTGCTVHVATLEMDAGPVLAQQEVEVRAGDSVETLHERIKQVERVLYPRTVRTFVERLESEAPANGTTRARGEHAREVSPLAGRTHAGAEDARGARR